MEIHPSAGRQASPNGDIEHANAMAIDDQGSAINEHERRSTDAEQQEERRQELRRRTEAALGWDPAQQKKPRQDPRPRPEAAPGWDPQDPEGRGGGAGAGIRRSHAP